MTRRPAEIVAVVPFWSRPEDMNADSNYSYLRTVLPHFADAAPDWLWVVFWPDRSYASERWTWHGDSFFDDRRITRYPWAYDTQVRTGTVGFDPKRFKRADQTLAPTVYWLHQTEMGGFFHGGYEQTFTTGAWPVLINQHHYIIHDSLPYPVESQFARLWTQLGSAVIADRNVFNSQHCARMLRETASRYIAPEQVDRIFEKATVLPFGLLDGEDNIAIREHPLPVVVYNHRREAYKQPHVTADVLRSLKQRHRFEVWLTQLKGQDVKLFPVDRVVGAPARRDYLDSIAVPAINTTNSVHETFCISMLDSIALGHIPVAPRAVTFPELVPPDYPFLFGNRKEQTAILDHILETWPDVHNEWSSRLRTFARDTFGVKQYTDAYLNLIAQESDRYRRISHDNAKAKVRAKIDATFADLSPGDYRLHEMTLALRRNANLRDQSLPERRTVREWTEAGGGVSWTGREVSLTWPG